MNDDETPTERADRIEANEIEARRVLASEQVKARKLVADDAVEARRVVVDRPVHVKHRLTTGASIALAVLILVLGVGAYFIVRQIHHNQNTIESLGRAQHALAAETHRAQTAECTLLNSRRRVFIVFAQWLAVESDVEPAAGDSHHDEAVALHEQVVAQLRGESLPGCKLIPLPADL